MGRRHRMTAAEFQRISKAGSGGSGVPDAVPVPATRPRSRKPKRREDCPPGRTTQMAGGITYSCPRKDAHGLECAECARLFHALVEAHRALTAHQATPKPTSGPTPDALT